jgi:hypothetical protein
MFTSAAVAQMHGQPVANRRERNLISLLDEDKSYATWRVLPADKKWQGVVQTGLAAKQIAF